MYIADCENMFPCVDCTEVYVTLKIKGKKIECFYYLVYIF